MNYFEQEDILHLVITEEPESNSVELSPNITVELNAGGELIGVEILNTSTFIRDSILESVQAKMLQNVCGRFQGPSIRCIIRSDIGNLPESEMGRLEMTQTLTISDTLYEKLDTTARLHGLENVEQLLEIWQAREQELRQRREAVRRIDALRERLFTTYGEMPDSVGLIREDRAR